MLVIQSTAPRRHGDSMTPEHLDGNLVAAYLERRLGPEDRVRVEMHLGDCPECREEIAAVAATLRGILRRRRLLAAAPVVATAAVVILAVGIWTGRDRPTMPADGLRNGPSAEREGVERVQAWYPAAEATVPRSGLRFAWQSDSTGALYNFTVTDSSGLPVFRARTSDTTLALPDSVRLVPGSSYHWWVDVLLPDGRVSTTGLRRFEILP